MTGRQAHTQLTNKIMKQHGFNSQIAYDGRIRVSLNRTINTMEVMHVIDSEELPIDDSQVKRNAYGEVIITIS